MDSTELQPGYTPKSSLFIEQFLGKFSDWYPLGEISLENVPAQPGVYVIRVAGRKISRLRGKSDIMYIGSSTGKGGLKIRLGFYLRPGIRQYTSQRINRMAKKYRMEISWCLYDKARILEHQLLERYEAQHDELPPLNRAKPMTLKF